MPPSRIPFGFPPFGDAEEEALLPEDDPDPDPPTPSLAPGFIGFNADPPAT